MVSSQARRDQMAMAMERGHSQRQACELIELPRSLSPSQPSWVPPSVNGQTKGCLYPRWLAFCRYCGSEFISHAILSWLAEEGIETALIDPSKPWQNANNESFNGKFRDECLSMEW